MCNVLAVSFITSRSWLPMYELLNHLFFPHDGDLPTRSISKISRESIRLQNVWFPSSLIHQNTDCHIPETLHPRALEGRGCCLIFILKHNTSSKKIDDFFERSCNLSVLSIQSLNTIHWHYTERCLCLEHSHVPMQVKEYLPNIINYQATGSTEQKLYSSNYVITKIVYVNSIWTVGANMKFEEHAQTMQCYLHRASVYNGESFKI